MSERPFMQFYPSDFAGDTLGLTAEQVGSYMMLLISMWNAGGELPDNEKTLSTIARLSLKKWRSTAPVLMRFFVVKNGSVSHNRMTKEIRKSERQSQSRRSAGERGGRANALKNNKPKVASATRLLQHLPEPYRKEEISDLKDKGDPVIISLDRHASSSRALFRECERISGVEVPSYLQRFSFPQATIDLAMAALEPKLRAV